jgi:hypothetical protein
MRRNLIDSLLGEKSRGSLQDLAFLPQYLILAPQPPQLSRQVLPPFKRRRLDLMLTALVEPAPQRRKADAEVAGDLPLRPTTHLNQPNGFGRKFLPEPSLRLAHEMLLFPSEELSTFPRQVQRCLARPAYRA